MLSTSRSSGPRIWRGVNGGDEAFELHEGTFAQDTQRRGELVKAIRPAAFSFAWFLMRLEIKITRRFLRHCAKDRPGHHAAIIQFRLLVCASSSTTSPTNSALSAGKYPMNETISLPVFVAAFGIDFLRRPGFSRDGKTANSGRCGGAAITHDTAQGITDLAPPSQAKLPVAKQPAKNY